jgi:hypothetical protein
MLKAVPSHARFQMLKPYEMNLMQHVNKQDYTLNA